MNAQVFTDGAPNETKVFRVGRAARGAAVPVGADPKDPVVAKDLKDVLRQLGKMGVMHVYCEGGLALARSLADAGLVDVWISFLAPIVIGSNPLKNALRFHQYSGGGCGDDMESRYELPCWRLRRHR